MKTYGRKCEAVYDYVNLLNTGSHFEKFREERVKQVFFTRQVDYDKLIDALEGYAEDPFYTEKLKEIILILREDYFGVI